MGEFNQNNAVLRFCIDSFDSKTITGRVVSRRLTVPVAFNDFVSLALQLDKTFTRQNFPQAFQSARTFLRIDSPEDYIAAEPSLGLTEECISAQRGDILTFDITVTSRRNSSWQGIVTWVDTGEQQEFPSAMGFLRMLEQKLQTCSR